MHKLIYIGLIKCTNFVVHAGSTSFQNEPHEVKTSLNASKHSNSISCDLSFINLLLNDDSFVQVTCFLVYIGSGVWFFIGT